MIIVGIDVETTGLDPTVDEIVEFGAAVYDTEASQFIAFHSALFSTNQWSVEAEQVHKISKASSDLGYGADFNPWSLIERYKPSMIVAHNAPFDNKFVTKRWSEFGGVQWVCTQDDLPHHKVIGRVSSMRLSHLAVDYNIEFSYRHRALFDAITCCLIASKHDLQIVSKLISEPQYLVEAWHPRPNFNDQDFITAKNYLKKVGFKWDGTKKWYKQVAESQVDKHIELATAKPGWKFNSERMEQP